MSQQLHVRGFSVSLDGYSAGPDQSLSNPLGTGGERLHNWMAATRTFSEREGLAGTGEGINDLFVRSHFDGIGATIMGRNMFGPVRGAWESSDAWNGWWGGNPPYHHPVFVLTNHPRDSVEMDGGTTFHFITGGIGEARDRALVAAGGQDVLVGGGADTVRQYLRAGLIDRIHLVMVPILLGNGERLLEDLAGPDGSIPSYRPIDLTPSGSVVHIQLAKEEEGVAPQP